MSDLKRDGAKVRARKIYILIDTQSGARQGKRGNNGGRREDSKSR